MPVRGWLLVLCVLLTIWNPAALALAAASRVGNSTSAIVLVTLAVRVIVTGIGVAAGMALWHGRPGAVRLAKASLVLSTVEVIALLSTRAGLSQAPPGTRLPLAIALTVFNGCWYLYLEKSRRVRATYGLESPSIR